VPAEVGVKVVVVMVPAGLGVKVVVVPIGKGGQAGPFMAPILFIESQSTARVGFLGAGLNLISRPIRLSKTLSSGKLFSAMSF